MSVRQIKSGRFDGIRVQRTIAGVPVIKTWSYRVPQRSKDETTEWRDATEAERNRMLAQAEKFDAKLAKQQKAKAVAKVYDPFAATKRNNTGIRGLNFRKRKEGGTEVEVFILTLSGEDKQMHNRYHRVDTLGYEAAWNKAIDEISELKGLSAVVVKRMRDKMPDHETLSKSLEKKREPGKRKQATRTSTTSSSRPGRAAVR